MIWLLRKIVFLYSEGSALQMTPKSLAWLEPSGWLPMAGEVNSLGTNCTGIFMLHVLWCKSSLMPAVFCRAPAGDAEEPRCPLCPSLYSLVIGDASGDNERCSFLVCCMEHSPPLLRWLSSDFVFSENHD